MEFLFNEERNVAVLTTTKVIIEKLPILYISHNEEGWQFHCGQSVKMPDAMIVSLEQIVKYDNSVNQLFDLPMGYRATRKSINDKWEWEKMEEDK